MSNGLCTRRPSRTTNGGSGGQHCAVRLGATARQGWRARPGSIAGSTAARSGIRCRVARVGQDRPGGQSAVEDQFFRIGARPRQKSTIQRGSPRARWPRRSGRPARRRRGRGRRKHPSCGGSAWKQSAFGSGRRPHGRERCGNRGRRRSPKAVSVGRGPRTSDAGAVRGNADRCGTCIPQGSSAWATPRPHWVRRVCRALRPLSAGPSGADPPIQIHLGPLPSRYGASQSKNATSARIEVQNNTGSGHRAVRYILWMLPVTRYDKVRNPLEVPT